MQLRPQINLIVAAYQLHHEREQLRRPVTHRHLLGHGLRDVLRLRPGPQRQQLELLGGGVAQVVRVLPQKVHLPRKILPLSLDPESLWPTETTSLCPISALFGQNNPLRDREPTAEKACGQKNVLRLVKERRAPGGCQEASAAGLHRPRARRRTPCCRGLSPPAARRPRRTSAAL